MKVNKKYVQIYRLKQFVIGFSCIKYIPSYIWPKGGSVARGFASEAGYQGSNPGRHRRKSLNKDRDSSTAKCLATGVSVKGPLRSW